MTQGHPPLSDRLRRATNAALARRLAGGLLLALLAAIYLAAYAGADSRPGSNPLHPEGWWGWWDQGRHLEAARALAAGTLDRESLWYPVGYAALAAPFVGVLPEHAFLIPDLVMVLAIALGFFGIARVFLDRAESLLLTAVLVLVLRRELVLSLVVPWNSIPTHLVSYAVLLVYLRGEARERRVVVASALTAAALWFRPIDALCLAPVLIAATFEIPGRRERLRAGALGGAVVAASFLATRALNRVIFDDWFSAYEWNERRIGFFAYEPLRKLYSLLLDGGVAYQTPDPTFLQAHPWLLLALPGVAVAARRVGWRLAPVLACAGLSLALYVSYNNFSPHKIYLYGMIHYLAWMLPLAGLAVYLGLRFGLRELRPATFALLAAGPVLLACVVELEVARRLPGRVAPGGVVVFDGGADLPDGARFDLLLVPGPHERKRLAVAGTELRRFREFVPFDRPGGSLIVLAERTPPARFEILDGAVPGEAALLELEWRFRFPNAFLQGIARRSRRDGSATARPPDPG